MKFLDLHYHAAPDLFRRRYTVLEAGRVAKENDFTLTIKSHLGSTVDSVLMAQELGLPLQASLVLNRASGGVDYRRVLAELSKYQVSESRPLLIYFPTITCQHHVRKLPAQIAHPALSRFLEEGESVVEGGRLKAEAVEVLKLGLDYPIRFATGHTSREGIFALASEMQRLGLDRLLLTHPVHPCVAFSVEEVRALSENPFFWFEQTFLTRVLGHQQDPDYFRLLREVPRIFLSSDLGQTNTPDIATYFAEMTEVLRQNDFTGQAIEALVLHRAKEFLYGKAQGK